MYILLKTDTQVLIICYITWDYVWIPWIVGCLYIKCVVRKTYGWPEVAYYWWLFGNWQAKCFCMNNIIMYARRRYVRHGKVIAFNTIKMGCNYLYMTNTCYWQKYHVHQWHEYAELSINALWLVDTWSALVTICPMIWGQSFLVFSVVWVILSSSLVWFIYPYSPWLLPHGTILLSQCQCSNPEGYGYIIDMHKTTTQC